MTKSTMSLKIEVSPLQMISQNFMCDFSLPLYRTSNAGKNMPGRS